jgi:hypothetical protein
VTPFKVDCDTATILQIHAIHCSRVYFWIVTVDINLNDPIAGEVGVIPESGRFAYVLHGILRFLNQHLILDGWDA